MIIRTGSQNLFIAGTDTGVGKTHISCELIIQYRRAGVNAVGMKPVASGMYEVDGEWKNDDIEKIHAAANGAIERTAINQYAYRPFIAPHLAAAQAGELISLEKIEHAYRQLAAHAERVIVEGAGGLMTPLNDTQTFVDLAQRLALPVVLVVAIRLGAINHALLSQRVMQAEHIDFAGWVANYPDNRHPFDADMQQSLEQRLNAPLLGVTAWSPTAAAMHVE